MEPSEVKIDLLSKDTFSTYIEVGTRSYNQHYLHLWENRDSTPYITSSFTPEVLAKEMKNTNTALFVIRKGSTPVGILKIVKSCALEHLPSESTMLLEKIYILKEYSGKGIGKKVLNFVEDYARQLRKKIIWLDTMKHGPALPFYLNNGFQILKERQLGFKQVLDEERPMYILIRRV